MLGVYENFPASIHEKAYFTAYISNKTLQKALTQTLYNLNNATFKLEEITNPSVPQCTAIFEFGIAEEANFNYLDMEETRRILKIVRKKPFRIMDFFCALCYYKVQEGEKAPLKFDYYMIRFIFGKNSMEVRVFHERGPRHASPKDIISFIVTKINERLPRRKVKPLHFS